MKKILILCLLLFSLSISAQFYDDFSDGNYTANPRWFMTDMDAQMVENNGGYAVELHPIGNIENSNLKKGSFRTANTLTDNTWWGCDLTFDINKDSEGEISFYIASSLPSLGESSGTYLKINILSRSIYLVYCDGKTLKPIMESKKQLPYGEINFLCKKK